MRIGAIGETAPGLARAYRPFQTGLRRSATSRPNRRTAVTARGESMYQAVNGANNVIAAVPGITDPLLPAAEKTQLLGEAYFLRALVYFDLGRGWGGVPLALTPTRSKANGQGLRRSTQAQT